MKVLVGILLAIIVVAVFAAMVRRTNAKKHLSHVPRTGWSIGQVAFTYEDIDGEITYRTVNVRSVNLRYLKGECHKRQATRTFRIDRILGDLVDCDTGEILKPMEWARKNIR